jgi:hypothetical protein
MQEKRLHYFSSPHYKKRSPVSPSELTRFHSLFTDTSPIEVQPNLMQLMMLES